ncbi:THO complex subunit 1 [Nowakowskiella sp. JEL0078]|nr:THO complex subunit 1 [Nowakowskiella sp. JEL0078]
MTVLSHERNWVKWKNESCPPFERSPVSLDKKTEDPVEAASRRDARKWNTQSVVVRNRDWVGTEELTSLWKTGKDIESILRHKGKHFASNPLETHLAPLSDAVTLSGEYNNDIEPEYRADNDPLYNWRAFRIAMRDQVGLVSGLRDVSARGLLMELRAVTGQGAGGGDDEIKMENEGEVDGEAEDAGDVGDTGELGDVGGNEKVDGENTVNGNGDVEMKEDRSVKIENNEMDVDK